MSSVVALEVRVTDRRHWRSDAFWATVANFAQAGGAFLGLLLLSRLHGFEAAGQFAYAQALTAPWAQLLNCQVKALILTHTGLELPLELAALIRALSSAPGLILAAVLGLWVTPIAGIWMLARLADSWAEMFQAQDQREGRMPRAAASVGFRAILLIACLSMVPRIELAAGAYLALSLLVLICLDWRLLRLAPFVWSALKPVLRRGVLLGVILFLQAASTSIPRIVLQWSTDATTLGLFATLSVIMQTGNLAASAFGQGLLPSLTVAPLRRIALWACIPLVVAFLILVASQWIRGWLFEVLRIPETPVANHLLLAMGLAQLAIWPGAMIGYSLTARRLYRQLLWTALVIVGTSAAASLLLIPSFGAVGAAASIGLASLATLGMSFWNLIRTEGVA